MGRLRGFLWLIAGLVVAGLAGLVAFVTINRVAAQVSDEPSVRPEVSVVVAAEAIEARAMLNAGSVTVIEIAVDGVPEGAVADPADAVGRVTVVDLYPGEILLQQRLLDPNVTLGDGRAALVLTEDKVLMALPAADLMSRINVLKPGDRVDLLISLEFPTDRTLGTMAGGASSDEELATFGVLQNVEIAAIIGGGPREAGATAPPNALLFTLNPQDALVLKYVIDKGGVQDIVLRAPGMERPFSVEPVDVDYVINRYQIPEMGR